MTAVSLRHKRRAPRRWLMWLASVLIIAWCCILVIWPPRWRGAGAVRQKLQGLALRDAHSVGESNLAMQSKHFDQPDCRDLHAEDGLEVPDGDLVEVMQRALRSNVEASGPSINNVVHAHGPLHPSSLLSAFLSKPQDSLPLFRKMMMIPSSEAFRSSPLFVEELPVSVLWTEPSAGRDRHMPDLRVEITAGKLDAKAGFIWPSNFVAAVALIPYRRAIYRWREEVGDAAAVSRIELVLCNGMEGSELLDALQRFVAASASFVHRLDAPPVRVDVVHQYGTNCSLIGNKEPSDNAPPCGRRRRTKTGSLAVDGFPVLLYHNHEPLIREGRSPPVAAPLRREQRSSIKVLLALAQHQVALADYTLLLKHLCAALCEMDGTHLSLEEQDRKNNTSTPAPSVRCASGPDVSNGSTDWSVPLTLGEAWQALNLYDQQSHTMADMHLLHYAVDGWSPTTAPLPLPLSLEAVPSILVVTLDILSIPFICALAAPNRCRVVDDNPPVVVIIPGPSVPQSERTRVEHAIVECFLSSACSAPIISWYRPAADEAQQPVGFTRSGWTFKVTSEVNHPASRLTFPLKDIVELSIESVLLGAGRCHPQRAISVSAQQLTPRVLRWAKRNMYDPDFMMVRLRAPWAIVPTRLLLQEVCPMGTNCSLNASYAGSDIVAALRSLHATNKKRPTMQFTIAMFEDARLPLVTTIDLFGDASNVTSSPQPTLKPPTKAERKKRKRRRLLGENIDTHGRFAWHTENTDALTDAAAVHGPSVMNASTRQWLLGNGSMDFDALQWITFLHYPWVRDNLYHLHNDNLFPLVLAIELAEAEMRPTDPPMPRCRRLVIWPSSRSQVPLAFALDLFRLLFDEIVVMGDPRALLTPTLVRYDGLRRGNERCTKRLRADASESSVGLQAAGPLIFGRPPRPFSSEMRDVAPYVAFGVVNTWRQLVWDYAVTELAHAEHNKTEADALRLFGNVDVIQQHKEANGPPHHHRHEIFVTWIVRVGSRAMESDGALIGWILTTGPEKLRRQFGCMNCLIRLQLCCERLSFPEQVAMMRRTDILIGVHGAGLLHTVFLDPIGRQFRVAAADSNNGATAMVRRQPLVVHIGSLHMNYHEQCIIERLALLSNTNRTHRIRFTSIVATSSSSVRDAGATWRSAFRLDAEAIKDTWHHALWTYFYAA